MGEQEVSYVIVKVIENFVSFPQKSTRRNQSVKDKFTTLNTGKTMKKKRFSESQIMAILKQQESGLTVGQIVREHGISEATFYNWKQKYGGMNTSELKRLKDLENENRRLKQLYAEVSLENAALREVLLKK
jgi:putative transposase